MEIPPPTADSDLIDAATADAAGRLRSKLIGSISCKEAEELLDGNFRLNDEICTALRHAWDTAVRLDCQLGEADRPWEDRNRWMQALAFERADLEHAKAQLETDILCVKLDVQRACASSGMLESARLADVLEANLRLRGRCTSFAEQLESSMQSARHALMRLGEAPNIRPEVVGRGMTVRWHAEFNSARETNDAMLKALRHPSAAVAVPACALEEQCDHNWRFILELVGLFERVTAHYKTNGQSSSSQDPGGPESCNETLVTTAELLRVELEARLPSLLECKLTIQNAAARGAEQDIALATENISASQQSIASALRFLMTNSIDLSNAVPTKFAEEMLPHPAAFGTSGGAADLDNEVCASALVYAPVVRMLTYNIFIRAPAPQFTHNTDDDRKDERLSRFVEHLHHYDLVFLQEAFGAFSNRRDWLVSRAEELGFKDFHRSSLNVRPRFLIDSGLLIMSRLPIVKMSSLVFESGMHIDRLSAKGALYAKVQCGPAGPYLHTCTTHLQSTYSEDTVQQSHFVRLQQITQLIEFLQTEAVDADTDAAGCSGSRRRWPMLLCGTFNFNGRRGPMDGGHSAEYSSILELFREKLGDVRDLLYDVCGSHPVTYADTRLTSSGEVPAEKVLTNSSVYEKDMFKRQCLDYMFFFPHQLGEEMGEGAPYPPEPIVPATCQIQKFLVDRAKDIGAPVTQLSDHYGVEGTLAVIVKAKEPGCTAPEEGTAPSEAEEPEGGAQEGAAAPEAEPDRVVAGAGPEAASSTSCNAGGQPLGPEGGVQEGAAVPEAEPDKVVAGAGPEVASSRSCNAGGEPLGPDGGAQEGAAALEAEPDEVVAGAGPAAASSTSCNAGGQPLEPEGGAQEGAAVPEPEPGEVVAVAEPEAASLTSCGAGG